MTRVLSVEVFRQNGEQIRREEKPGFKHRQIPPGLSADNPLSAEQVSDGNKRHHDDGFIQDNVKNTHYVKPFVICGRYALK